MAESVEKQVKDMNLHNVNSTVLSKKNDVERENLAETESEGSSDIGNSKSLDDFSNQSSELRYNITLRNGKVYNISKKERALVVEETTKKVKEYISSQFSLLSDSEKEQYLLKVMQYGN